MYIKKTQKTFWVFSKGILNTFRDFRDLNLYVHIHTQMFIAKEILTASIVTWLFKFYVKPLICNVISAPWGELVTFGCNHQSQLFHCIRWTILMMQRDEEFSQTFVRAMHHGLLAIHSGQGATGLTLHL